MEINTLFKTVLGRKTGDYNAGLTWDTQRFMGQSSKNHAPSRQSNIGCYTHSAKAKAIVGREKLLSLNNRTESFWLSWNGNF